MAPVYGFMTTAEPPVGWWPIASESWMPCSTAFWVARWMRASIVSFSVGSDLPRGIWRWPAMRPSESTRTWARTKPGLSNESYTASTPVWPTTSPAFAVR